MTVVRTYNTPVLLTTVLILVLSVLACRSSYLTTVPTTPTKPVVKPPTTPDNTLTTAQVTASDALHVRAEPMGLVIGYLYHGAEVTLTNKCSEDPAGWAQIEWQDAVGWVNAKYLSDNKCKEGE